MLQFEDAFNGILFEDGGDGPTISLLGCSVFAVQKAAAVAEALGIARQEFRPPRSREKYHADT